MTAGDVVVITGSAGLIGSEAATRFVKKGATVVGIDNDLRAMFFGAEASTRWNRSRLESELGSSYRHMDIDIRNAAEVNGVFKQYSGSIVAVIHAAAQPSHDWAASDPQVDFAVNANGTLNVLEATRHHSPGATFVYTSTNKVYGDLPNRLPMIEGEKRWEIDPSHRYANGIGEDMSIDASLHSLFGASKASADLLVQEYGRYFGMATTCFRAGCLTGPNHSAAQLHGFLAYLMRCTTMDMPYKVFGYKGKQVRDNIHSSDFVAAIEAVVEAPRSGQVYNLGGGSESNCSMIEAIEMCESITGNRLQWSYVDQHRMGDHIWYVSDLAKFKGHYPSWGITADVPAILEEIYEVGRRRWPTTYPSE